MNFGTLLSLKTRTNRLFLTLVVIVVCSACSATAVETSPSTPSRVDPTGTESPTAASTGATETVNPDSGDPMVTSAPLAAMVNGERILLEDYQVELTLYNAVVGTGLATDKVDIVMEDLIDQVLLAQAANASGFIVDEEMLKNRIDTLGLSDQALSEWMKANGYSEEGFTRAMKRSIAAAWMRDQILAETPSTAEQVHARQILFYNLGEAEAVYAQLQAGADFETLAIEADPITKGELGWFPRGYLMVPELDDVIFSLEPGAYSPIIETMVGYHIVQVIERDANHPLSTNALQIVQLQTLAQWLEDRRSESEIILINP